MKAALIVVGWNCINYCPWVILGTIPFWDKMRVKKSTIISWIILVNSIYLFLIFSSKVFVPEDLTPIFANTIAPLTFYVLIGVFYLIGFAVHWSKFVYMFLFLYTASSLINSTSLMIAQYIYGENTRISYSATPIYPLIIAVLNIISFPFLIQILRNKLRPVLNDLSNREVFTLCILPVLFMLMNTLAYSSNAYKRMDDMIFIFMVLLSQFSGVISFFWGLRLMSESKKRAMLEAENLRIGQIVELQQKGYSQLTEHIERTKAERHDMRFHLSVISGYQQRGESQKLTKYLEEYNRKLEGSILLPLCNHNTVDILAHHFVGQMESLGAETDVKLLLNPEINIADSDLCVVFGNLFENALHSLETQKGDKFFYARSRIEGSMAAILMENSCELINSQFQKGIGLNSVHSIAEKYNGLAEFECRNGKFCANIVLTVPE